MHTEYTSIFSSQPIDDLTTPVGQNPKWNIPEDYPFKDEPPLVLTPSGKNYKCSIDILEWCDGHSISAKDFMHPIVFDEDPYKSKIQQRNDEGHYLANILLKKYDKDMHYWLRSLTYLNLWGFDVAKDILNSLGNISGDDFMENYKTIIDKYVEEHSCKFAKDFNHNLQRHHSNIYNVFAHYQYFIDCQAAQHLNPLLYVSKLMEVFGKDFGACSPEEGIIVVVSPKKLSGHDLMSLVLGSEEHFSACEAVDIITDDTIRITHRGFSSKYLTNSVDIEGIQTVIKIHLVDPVTTDTHVNAINAVKKQS